MAIPDPTQDWNPALCTGSSGATSELLKLLTFLSPAFPVGSFAYSHGLEWLIDSGAVRTPHALRSWLTDLIEIGSGWNDAVLFLEAYRAARSPDAADILAIAELAEALATSRERHLESMAQGGAFIAAVSAALPCTPIRELSRAGGAPYAVAVAAAAAGHRLHPSAALAAWLNAFAASLVSVAVRLVPLGQNEGLRVLVELHAVIEAVVQRAARSDLDDLGSATILADIASMRHEEQCSRVFRT